MANLDSVLKSRDITLLTKVYIVKSMCFSNSHVWMWVGSKEGWVPKNWYFQNVNKEMSLLFNTLSKLVIVFLLRSRRLSISWLWSPSTEIWQPKNFSPFYLPWSDGTRCHGLRFLSAEFQISFFTLLFHPHQETFYFLFIFCHQNDIMCTSEIVNISAKDFDCCLWFIQPSIPHDILCIWVK